MEGTTAVLPELGPDWMLEASEREQPVDGAAMPEPYRSLLVHERDMTSTLEAFHGEALGLRVLAKQLTRDSLRRRVVLEGVDSGRGVEFGAIRIHLGGFEGEALEAVRSGEQPLGTILGRFGADYRSRPAGFFSIRADAAIAGALRRPLVGRTLYGRRNRLTWADGSPLADVVEILPPE